MSVVVAFNTLLVQFMTELSETFPDDKKLFIYKTIIQEVCKGEAMVGMQTFQDELTKFADKIVARDDSMFDECRPLFGRVDLGGIWKSHDFTEANKDVFWEYMHAMLDMCQQTFPPLPSTALVVPSHTPDPAAPTFDLSSLPMDLSSLPMDLSSLPTDLSSLPMDLSSLPPNLASMLPEPMMAAAAEMLQGVDMNDILSLAKDLDENDVRGVMESIDPSVLASLSTGNFNAKTLSKLQESIHPDRLLEIVGKFDKTKLAKLASQVDQEKLMGLVQPLKPKSRRK